MPTLTASERVLRNVLIEAAIDGATDPSTITYTELGERAQAAGCPGPYPMLVKPFRGLGPALGKISAYEHALGRPLLSALVVRAESGRPGAGFTQLARDLGLEAADPEAFWHAEVAAVTQFWRDEDPTRVVDAAFTRVLDLLRLIRRYLGGGSMPGRR